MILVHCHQTTHFLILYFNLLIYTMGFGIPSPLDVHTVLSSMDSLQHLNNHLANGNFAPGPELCISTNPLGIKDTFANEVRGIYDAIKQATVTKRVDNALAGVIAEAASGATGALISRKTTVVMTGKKNKRDSLGTKMRTTGAFFGARVGTEGLSRILGVPRPLGLLLAAIVGSFISTTVKAEGRIADQSAAEARSTAVQSERKPYYFVDGEFIVNMDVPEVVPKPLPSWSAYYCGDGEFLVNMDPPPSVVTQAIKNDVQTPVSHVLESHPHRDVAPKETMTLSEIAGDICKWMTFDNLVVNSEWTSGILNWTDNDRSHLNVLFGSIAAVAGKYVQDLSVPKDAVSNAPKVQERPIQYAQTAFEGGVLFGTYKSTLSFLNSVVPEDWNKEFLFEFILENLEKNLPGL